MTQTEKMAKAETSKNFGAKFLVRNFWREIIGAKILARNFRREIFDTVFTTLRLPHNV